MISKLNTSTYHGFKQSKKTTHSSTNTNETNTLTKKLDKLVEKTLSREFRPLLKHPLLGGTFYQIG